MKTINKLFAALITTATLVACSNDDDIQTDRMDAVQILTTVSNGEALTSGNRASNRTGNTRADAATDPTYTTAAGTLNLYYGSVNATQSSTFTCAAGQWSTAAPLYWQDLVPATDASKYTFFAVAPAPLADAATGSVATDQSDVAAAGEVSSFEAADLLMARATTDKSGTLTLPLKHLMSQLKVTLATTTDADALTAEELATAALRIDGLQTAYTVDYTAATNEVPAVAIPSGDVANGLAPYVDGTGAAKAFRFIAPAQATKSGSLKLRFTLTIAGVARNYNYTTTADQAFAAGAITQFDITVNRTSVEKINITVKEWETPAALTGTMGVDITNTATSGTVDGINTLSLWNTKDAATKTEYTFNAATSLWSSPTPFYLDDLTETDAFFARHTPTMTDAVSALPDVLGNTVSATQKDGGIALELKHLMSKLNIALLKGTIFPAGVSLANATLTMNGFKKTADISDENVVTGKEIADNSTYTLTTDAAANASFIVAPQTLAAGTQFIVKLKKAEATNTYTATLSKALTLDAGKIATLNLVLEPTKMSISATMTPWSTDTESTQDIRMDGLTDGSSKDEIEIKATEGDQLTLTYLTAGQPDNAHAANYLYTANAWTCAAPLYWDSFAQATQHTFAALYTPKATPTGDSETDYWAGITTTGLGTSPAFTLSHALARIELQLTASDFTTEEQHTATIQLLAVLPLATIAADGTTTTAATAMTKSMTVDEPGKNFSLILAPQNFKEGSRLATITLNGHTYGITTPANMKAEAGKTTLLKIKMNKTAVSGITVDLTEWASGNTHDGDAGYDD